MKKINYRVFLIILFLLLVINLSAWAIDFFELCESGTPEEIQKALQAGANINARTEYEATPLMVAALSNPNPEVIKILLQAGANINAIAEEGITPLMCAAANNPNPEVINALLQAGADPFITDNKGKRAIDYAQKGTKNFNLLAQSTSGEESDKGVQPTSEGEYFIALECLDTPTNDEVNETIKIIKNRLDLLGFSESIIRRCGFGHILMELPNDLDTVKVSSLVIVPGFLEFKNDKGDTQLTGAHLINAKSSFDQFSRSVVLIEFDKIGAKEFGEATKNNVGKVLAITLDGKEISAPVVQEPILDGKAQITGKFTVESANHLAILLRAGALPVKVEILENRSVGPTLGRDSISKGTKAGIVGLILILIFMLIYYKGFGLVADFALVVCMILIVGALAGLKATLTLPGIAGIILTIGMAVDANILIFERIKEELRLEKTFRASIDAGFNKAFNTIFDANVTTLIAALALFYFGSGPIKGFAVTLSIGILASMFTAIVVTKIILEVVAVKFSSKSLL